MRPPPDSGIGVNGEDQRHGEEEQPGGHGGERHAKKITPTYPGRGRCVSLAAGSAFSGPGVLLPRDLNLVELVARGDSGP